MRTAAEYRERLRSMQKNVYHNGELIGRDHPALAPGINVISLTFDAASDPELQELVTATSHLSGQSINRFTHIHQSPDDLMKKQEMTRRLCQKTGGCIQRCMGIDALNALSVITKEVDNLAGTEYHERFLAYLRYFQENDLVGCCAQTDVKGDRSKRPHQQIDPDLYVHIVERKSDGIVVRGAKANITIAAYSDEIIAIPTRFLTPEEGDWAVAFAIPADSQGVKLITRATSPRPREQLRAPMVDYGAADSVVIFDNVFVPWERVFLCGEHQAAGLLAALFATYHRHSYTGCKPATTDLMMGAAALAAEYNGVGKASHVRDKLADLIAVAELVYAAGIAAAVKSTRYASGTYVPDFVFTNVGRYHAGTHLYHEYEIVADLAGGLPATLPPERDWFNPETRPYLEKYIMRNPAVSAENQHRLFRALSDVLCSSLGGVMQVAGIHGGGSPIMERIAITQQYDLESKKSLFKRLAGIPAD